MSLDSSLLKDLDNSGLPAKILDSLPYAISIQKNSREVIYENKKMVEIFDSRIGNSCYTRWSYLDDYTNAICVDCPSKFSIHDGKEHFIIRKTENKDGEEMVLEIRHVPIFESDGSIHGFIEIMQNVTPQKKVRYLQLLDREGLKSKVFVALTQFNGLPTNMVIQKEPVPFISSSSDSEIEFYGKSSIFWTAAIGQGSYWKSGFFGPLPLLDIEDYQTYAFSFRLKSEQEIDDRLEGESLLLLQFFVPFEATILLTNQPEIKEFISEWVSQYTSVEDIRERFNILEFKERFFEKLKRVNIEVQSFI